MRSVSFLLASGVFWLLSVSPAPAEDKEPQYDGKALGVWVTLLKDRDQRVRWEAALALKQLGRRARTAVPALVPFLKDKDNGLDQKVAAVDALGVMGFAARAAVPALAECLTVEDLRSHALQALARIGPAAVPALVAALKQPDAALRAAVLETVAGLGSDAGPAVPALLELLQSSVVSDRLGATRSLAALGADARPALSGLIAAFADPDDGVNKQAADAVAEIGPVALPALVTALGHQDVRVRRGAARALLSLSYSRDVRPALAALREALKDADPETNSAVVSTLAEVGKPAFPIVRAALTSPEVPVRRGAADALGRLAHETRRIPGRLKLHLRPPAVEIVATVPALLTLLADPDATVRASAAEALGLIGPEARQAVLGLAKATTDPDRRVRLAAVGALNKLEAEARPAVSALAAALKTNDPEIQEAAANALCEPALKARQAVPALCAALKDTSSRVRSRAAVALGLGDFGADAKVVVPALAAALQDADGDVASSAAEALGRLGPAARTAVPQLLATLKQKDRRLVGAALRALNGVKASLAEVELVFKDPFKDPETDIRVLAVHALERSGKESIPRLRAFLTGPDRAEQRVAVEALGRLGPQAREAIPDLIEAFEDNTYRTRSITEALRKIGTEAVPALAAALKHKRTVVGRNAAQALAEFRSEAMPALPALIEALAEHHGHGYLDVGPHASNAIQALGKEAVPGVQAALKHKDKRIRGKAAAILGQSWHKEQTRVALPDLIAMSTEADAEVRASAVSALGGLGVEPRTTVPALVKALKDPEKAVRTRAVEALGRFGPRAEAAVPALLEALKETPERRLDYVPETLGLLGKAGLPGLLEALRHGDEEVRKRAVSGWLNALWRTPDLKATDIHETLKRHPVEAAEAASYLGKQLRTEDSQARDYTLVILVGMGPVAHDAIRAAVPALRADLWDARPEVRRKTVEQLAKLGPLANAAVPDLLELFEDDDKSLRLAAAAAVVRVSSDRAAQGLTLLTNALKQQDYRLAGAAAQTLGELGPLAQPAVPALVAALGRRNCYLAALDALERLGPTARAAIPALIQRLPEEQEALLWRPSSVEWPGFKPTPIRDALKKIDRELARELGIH